jgi:hypothetical protein
LPAVANTKQSQGFPPARSIPPSKISELKGIMVEAKNDPKNSPTYPKSKKYSINKKPGTLFANY